MNIRRQKGFAYAIGAILFVLSMTGCAGQQPVRNGTIESPPTASEQPISDLPATKTLPVELEGMTALAPAKLVESELGYALYIMDHFEFTPEEPGRDIIFHQQFPDYFARIEPLPGDADMEHLRTHAEQMLEAVGSPVTALQGDEITDPAIRANAEFVLHAEHAEGSVDLLVMKIGDRVYRFMLNIPDGEAAEGITPRFYAMIDSIVDQ